MDNRERQRERWMKEVVNEEKRTGGTRNAVRVMRFGVKDRRRRKMER